MQQPTIRLVVEPWRTKASAAIALTIGSLLLSGCASSIPTSGPSRTEILATPLTLPSNSPVRVVNVDEGVARRLLTKKPAEQFADLFREARQDTLSIGPGDMLEVSIWEAPPATLFGGVTTDARAGGAINTSRQSSLPEQAVNTDGNISVPFVGAVSVSGRTPQQIEAEITDRLKGKANQPQVMVRVTRAASSSVTVVGDVATSVRLPLSARNERLLDALAAAGGTRQPLNKTTVQLTRGAKVLAMPLESVVRDPRQNVSLRAGDVVTAFFQPLSFTALGATGRNDEINYEAQGISVAQALGRIGGLQDARADAKGVFIFRYETEDATADADARNGSPPGPVPTIYVFDLSNPTSFFIIQSFQVQNRDLVYVANASLTEFQKFANAVFSIAFPLLNTISITR